MTNTIEGNSKAFYHKLIVIGVPVLIQQMISIGLNLADTIMVGWVSETALAAVGAANQIYFIFSVFLFGILSGASVYTVQYWGIKDLDMLRKILGIGYMMCGIVSAVVMIGAYALAPQLISLFVKEPEVIALGAEYMRIAVFSYVFAGFSFAVIYNSRAIMMLKIPTIINGIAIGINICLNYCLIFGKFGFPEMGVKGAAYATLTARVLECAAMYIAVYLQKGHPLRASLKEMTSFSGELYVKVMKTAVPVIINEGMWALAMSMTFAAYGKISASAFAVVQIASTIMEFFQTTYIGVGNAAVVIIGDSLGRGEKRPALVDSKRIMKITVLLNVVMAVVIVLSRGFIADIYQFNPETTQLLKDTLFVYILSMFPRTVAYIIICGILRAGGDTLFGMYIDVGFNVLMQVPLAYLAVMVFDLSLPLAVAVAASADVCKAVWCVVRYRSNKWLNTVTGVEQEGENDVCIFG